MHRDSYLRQPCLRLGREQSKVVQIEGAGGLHNDRTHRPVPSQVTMIFRRLRWPPWRPCELPRGTARTIPTLRLDVAYGEDLIRAQAIGNLHIDNVTLVFADEGASDRRTDRDLGLVDVGL